MAARETTSGGGVQVGTPTLPPRNTLQRSVQWLLGRKQRGELRGEAVGLVAFQFRKTGEEILVMVAELEEALGE